MNKSDKKILAIVTTPFYQEKGASLRAFSVIKVLAQKYQMDLVTYSLGQDISLTNVRIFRTPLWYQPKIGISQISVSKLVLDFFVFVRCLRLMMTNKYDIVHSEDFEAAFIGRLLIFFSTHKDFVYDLHNRILDNLSLKAKIKSGLFKKIISKVESLIIKRCNLIILNWNKYKDDRAFTGKKTLLYYDQIDLSAFKPHPLPAEKYLVYAGNFEPYQGLEEFLSVYQACSTDYSLVLIGEPSKSVGDLSVVNPELATRVYLTGRLDIAESNYLIKNYLAAILPRRGEGSSMKVIHYLMLGKAVIARETNSNKELLKDNYNSFLYSDAADLKCLLESLETSDGLNRISAGVKKTSEVIKDNWSAENFLKKYEDNL